MAKKKATQQNIRPQVSPALTVGLPDNFVAALEGIRQQWAIIATLNEYLMKQGCAHCLIDLTGKAVSRVHVNGWYHQPDNLLIYYWLCPDCTDKIEGDNFEVKREMLATIMENTLAAFKANNSI